MKLSHLDEHSRSRMVDVGGKEITCRVAVAEAQVCFPAEVYAQIQAANGQSAKGTITEVARLAGIMAAKDTAQLIPLCHPMMLERCQLNLDYQDHSHSLLIRAEVAVTHKTGVEMEALTAVQVALLTVYDMCKAADRGMAITGVRLLEKHGGKSGSYVADAV